MPTIKEIKSLTECFTNDKKHNCSIQHINHNKISQERY